MVKWIDSWLFQPRSSSFRHYLYRSALGGSEHETAAMIPHTLPSHPRITVIMRTQIRRVVRSVEGRV
jgi:hypothetical protein